MAQYGIGQGLDYSGGGQKLQQAKPSGFSGILGGMESDQSLFSNEVRQPKPEAAYERFPMQPYQQQAPESQVGPGAQYQQQMPGDFITPWTGGFPGQTKKRRFPWQQDYEQPQGGMSGMQSGPGYMQQGAPWLDGNHMQGIQRRGTPM